MRWSNLVLTALLVSAFVLAVHLTLHYRFPEAEIDRARDETMRRLETNGVQQLLNGASVGNIPTLRLETVVPELNRAVDCGLGPVYLGERVASDADCVRVCLNGSATAINVPAGDTSYRFDSVVLRPGAHCRIGPRLECNPRTTYVLMTINAVSCRSKFPNLIGGETGANVIACNNQTIQDPQNQLWDYGENRPVDVLRTRILAEDERLQDGSFRYRCRFLGLDARRNKYIEHPLNRFHPYPNYCARELYAAHPDVTTRYDADRKTFVCECGDPGKTRVFNRNPDNPASVCVFERYTDTVTARNRHVMGVPYRCFTLYSPLSDVGRLLPCHDEMFTRLGGQLATIKVPYSTELDDPIEHPMYAKMAGKVWVRSGSVVVT